MEALMPTVEALLHAIEQLDRDELDQFVNRVLALRARRLVGGPNPGEAELLQKINRGLPPDVQGRYEELIEKRDAHALAPEEYTELLRLTETAEQADVER